jgi:hypothetical protein
MSSVADRVPSDSPAAVEAITAALAAPFNPAEVKFRAGAVSGNRALALAYVDCRTICDRLDAVCGVCGWQDSYRVLPDGSVMCRLRLRIGGEWVTKVDVGSPSEQPDAGDRTKAGFSDALKRAAVKFGVGRYLYRLPVQWVDYDPARRQFKVSPALPAWARPASENKSPPQPGDASKKPAAIGGEGALKLIALADRKGRAISSYLPPGVDSPGLLTAAQARTVWKTLDALPDARPAANGAGGTVRIEDSTAAAAASRPPARGSVPF